MAAAEPLPAAAPLCAHFVKYDVSQWPLVRVTAQPGVVPDDATFTAHLACFEELLHRNKPFYILFDIRNGESASISQLKRQAEQMKELKPLILRNLVCSAIAVDGILLKGLIDFVFAIRPPSKPNKRFAAPHDAEAWMKSMWDKAMPSKFFFE